MVHEARKTNTVRNRVYFDTYFKGRVLDIGCGWDPVTPAAIRFDKQHGDAQHITRYFAPGSFDCIHSSHCLEHMPDTLAALLEWWRLVKSGGYLIFTVPDEDLYEQGAWPSLFNKDHKATFRLGGTASWSPVSFDVERLARKIPNAEILSIKCMRDHYEDRYRREFINSRQRAAYKVFKYPVGVLQYLLGPHAPQMYAALMRAGLPIDQTLGPALAQIEVVLKRTDAHIDPARS